MRLLVLAILGSAAAAGDIVAKHDDGTRTGKQSISVAGHGITYPSSPDHPFLRSVLIHGAHYGEGYDPARTYFDVLVRDPKGGILARARAPYGLFRRHLFTWVEVPLDQPVRAPPQFQIVVDFHATATRGVYVGYADVADSHSCHVPREGGDRPFARGKDWMIRARLSVVATPLRTRRNADVAKVIRNTTVGRTQAGTLAGALEQLRTVTDVPIVLDVPGAASVPGIPEGTCADALDALARCCGLVWDIRWGLVFVTTPDRLARTPTAVEDAGGQTPTPPGNRLGSTETARLPLATSRAATRRRSRSA